jgi:hypothetical protein
MQTGLSRTGNAPTGQPKVDRILYIRQNCARSKIIPYQENLGRKKNRQVIVRIINTTHAKFWMMDARTEGLHMTLMDGGSMLSIE